MGTEVADLHLGYLSTVKESVKNVDFGLVKGDCTKRLGPSGASFCTIASEDFHSVAVGICCGTQRDVFWCVPHS
jgi:hypothetical protein